MARLKNSSPHMLWLLLIVNETQIQLNYKLLIYCDLQATP